MGQREKQRRRRPSTSPPRRPSSRLDRLPELVLVGADSGVDRVAGALGSLAVRLRRVDDAGEVRECHRAVAVVVVALGERPDAARRVRSVRERAPDLPVFVVLSDDPPAGLVRRLYHDAGTAGVFEWPRERATLGHHIAEMLSLRIARGKTRTADVALARVVRTHLKTRSAPAELPRVEARDGAISVTGTVDSLPLKREIERCIGSVPGVRSVDARGLHVLPEPVPDARIRAALRRLMARSRHVDERTLTFSVDGGHVTLTGTAGDRHELRHIQDLATRLRGVRDVELRMLVAPGPKREDRGAVRRLRRALADLFPDEELRIAFFRGIAVLDGRVRNLETRRAVEAFVWEDDSVTRVVDKLVVGDGRADR